jgi:benzoate 4-monooxygenase
LFVAQLTKLSSLQYDPRTGYASIDALSWFNYLTFNIISDLAFSTPFSILEKGKDIAKVHKTPDSPPTYTPAIEVLHRHSEVSGTLRTIPFLKPYAVFLPDSFFSKGLKAIKNLARIIVMRVSKRLKPKVIENNTRVNLLARLIEGRNKTDTLLGRKKLIVEALTQLITSSNTTSNIAYALLYWVLKIPRVIKKLQKSMDKTLPEGVEMPTFAQLKDIP